MTGREPAEIPGKPGFVRVGDRMASPIERAALLLGIRQSTLRAKMARGETSWLPVNGYPYFEEADLERLVRQREKEANGYVYFIGRKPSVKIGFTTNLLGRFKTIQSTFPTDLQIYAIMLGRPSDEKEMHLLFKDARSHGEWFTMDELGLKNVRGFLGQVPKESYDEVIFGGRSR